MGGCCWPIGRQHTGTFTARLAVQEVVQIHKVWFSGSQNWMVASYCKLTRRVWQWFLASQGGSCSRHVSLVACNHLKWRFQQEGGLKYDQMLATHLYPICIHFYYLVLCAFFCTHLYIFHIFPCPRLWKNLKISLGSANNSPYGDGPKPIRIYHMTGGRTIQLYQLF